MEVEPHGRWSLMEVQTVWEHLQLSVNLTISSRSLASFSYKHSPPGADLHSQRHLFSSECVFVCARACVCVSILQGPTGAISIDLRPL